MKKIVLLLFSFIFLFALSETDSKAFLKNFLLNPKANFNVVDYFVKSNGSINLEFPSIETKTVNKDFKVVVFKKIPFKYTLGIFSFDENKSINFSKELIFKSLKFDIWNIKIPYDYSNLRFYCNYKNDLDENKTDFSTDNFSVRPYKISTSNRDTNVFKIIIDDGEGFYNNSGSENNNSIKYKYSFKKDKGLVIFWASSLSNFNFCLDENWTSIDEDDTSLENRKMPCIKLILPPIKTGWGGIEANTSKKYTPVNLNERENIFIKRINW